MKKTITAFCALVFGLSALSAQDQPEARAAYVLSLKDFGSEDIAYLSLPQTAPDIAVVVLPGLMGLSKEMKTKCDFLAAQGFIVLALDLFNGQIPRDQADALRMQSEVRMEPAVKTIDAGRRFFAESPRFKTGKAVLLGWTVNTALALHVSNKVADLSGLVLLEPWLKKGDKVEYPKIPTMLVCSANDPAGLWLMGELKAQGLDQRLLTPIVLPSAPGFTMAAKAEDAQQDAWGNVINFIRRCAASSPAEKGLLDKIF